jgi:hypothetical protein
MRKEIRPSKENEITLNFKSDEACEFPKEMVTWNV